MKCSNIDDRSFLALVSHESKMGNKGYGRWRPDLSTGDSDPNWKARSLEDEIILSTGSCGMEAK